MRAYILLTILLSVGLITATQAQSTRDASVIIGRDVLLPSDAAAPKTQSVSVATTVTDAGVETAATDSNGLFIGGVNLQGAENLDRAAYAIVIDNYVGRTITRDQLPKLARALADRAREQGYIFASAIVPVQSVAQGVVTVAIDQGSVSEVRLVGTTNRKVRMLIKGIVGDSVRKETVERQLLLAGDVPGITVVGTRYSRENGRGILTVTVKEDKASGAIIADNFGSRAFGPVRVRLETEQSSLFADGDSLTTQILATPADPRELIFTSARYAVPINNAGTSLALAVASGRTQPDGGDLTGRTRYAAISANHPIVRANAASLWVNAEIAYLKVDVDLLGLLAQRDEIVTFSLSASGNVRFAGGRITGGLGFVQGLPVAGTTGETDILSSRIGADNDFTKVQAWLSWNRDLGNGFGLYLAANGQIASAPLFASQELGLGGPAAGRGYNFSERFGDSGVMGSIELRKVFTDSLPLVDWVRVYGFADGGYVYNLRSGFGGGALASAGGGVRTGFGRAEFGIETAFPITDPRFEGNTTAPRVNLSAGYRF
ncbi:MAG: ShlB/FhaC/HecB family hemolysin secretion/activation protein [Sphingomonadaceae bacterium]